MGNPKSGIEQEEKENWIRATCLLICEMWYTVFFSFFLSVFFFSFFSSEKQLEVQPVTVSEKVSLAGAFYIFFFFASA